MLIQSLTRTVLAIILFAVTLPAVAADYGNLKGKFVFDGTPPKPKKLDVNKDLECCGKYLDEIVDETVTVGSENGLANVFVYLRLAPGAKVTPHPDLEKKAAAETVVLDNIHCMFKPHAATLWVGKQKLIFKNSDPIGHAAKADYLKNSPVNVLIPAGAEIEQKLQMGESLPTIVTCGVHPWETAFIKVHDNPYITLTKTDGTFQIEKIPVGDWEFQFWHESCGFLTARPDWSKGRVKMKIKVGDTDLGTIKVAPSILTKK